MKKTVTKTKKVKPEKTAKKVNPLLALKPAELRFLTLYMGGEDGKGFNNATLSYLLAYDKWTPEIMDRDKETKKYDPVYNTARQEGYKLLTKPHIVKAREYILIEIAYKPETIKARYSELMNQNDNLPLALSATDRVAKIVGLISDDKKVDIPQLEEIGNSLKTLLTPRK